MLRPGIEPGATGVFRNNPTKARNVCRYTIGAFLKTTPAVGLEPTTNRSRHSLFLVLPFSRGV